MGYKSFVIVYTPNGEKIKGYFMGTPDDFRKVFHEFNLNRHSTSLGINLACEDGGFIRLPISELSRCIHKVEPVEDITLPHNEDVNDVE